MTCSVQRHLFQKTVQNLIAYMCSSDGLMVVSATSTCISRLVGDGCMCRARCRCPSSGLHLAPGHAGQIKHMQLADRTSGGVFPSKDVQAAIHYCRLHAMGSSEDGSHEHQGQNLIACMDRALMRDKQAWLGTRVLERACVRCLLHYAICWEKELTEWPPLDEGDVPEGCNIDRKSASVS